MTISNLPPKGTADWFPAEYAVRKYIFDTWRKACVSFGYQEYLTPLVELADVYRAKSGDDVGGKELTVFTDRGGRDMAIRPEMTPSVTRMVSRTYESMPKPIRLFSIANFFRNEKPQRGRNREFWQLNFDVFGSASLNADVEVLHLALSIMQQFGAGSEQFVMYLNNRDLIKALVQEYLQVSPQNTDAVIKTIDKFSKLPQDEFLSSLQQAGATVPNADQFLSFLRMEEDATNHFVNQVIVNYPGMAELKQVMQTLEQLGYSSFIKYNPSMVRGFDYYDGTVFEVFDKHPDNNRSLFGGGRYNGLAGIFGGVAFPAVGAAPGDETLRLFLEAWGLLPADLQANVEYYIPLLESGPAMLAKQAMLASNLRAQGHIVETGLEKQKLAKALEYANKKGVANVVIVGSQELEAGVYKVKNMLSAQEESFPLPA